MLGCYVIKKKCNGYLDKSRIKDNDWRTSVEGSSEVGADLVITE